ncbi:hypothetical protein IAU60_001966 [Kwoniella sp. DSM 27419]
MGLFSFFSKPSKPDYETVLARLATDINEAKTHLSEIRLRERRTSLLINLYGFGLWAVWVGLWWLDGLPLGLIGLSHRSTEGRAVGAAGIAAGPIVIYLLNRLIHFYFTRQRTREETHLRLLLTQQRKQVDEIKKATNYDSTRKLIERYDDASAGLMGSPNPQTPVQRRGQTPVTPTPAGGAQKGQVPPQQLVKGPGGTPRAPGHLSGAGGTPAAMGISPDGLTPEHAAIAMQMHAIQPVLPTPEKRWYDRVVDSILGEDPSQAAQSKFALVCGECFRHNGLVGSKYEWERMQWICPRCNHLNPSPLSRASAPLAMTPSTPVATPSKPATPQATPSAPHVQRAAPSPRARRQGARETPRSSRLGKEVFSASSESSDEGDDHEAVEEKMEVDDD